MAYSVTSAKSDLSGILHGTSLNQITNINGLLNRAGRQVLLDLDPQETKRTLQTSKIYDQVFDYSIPSDLKGNKIMDIRPQIQRNLIDNPKQTYSKSFDLFKDRERGPSFTIEFDTSVKTMRVNYPSLNTGIILNNADTLAGNGAWTVGGTATNLRLDSTLFLINNGSIECDLSAGANPSTGYFENSTMPVQDLTTHFNQSTLFYNLYLPTGSAITSTEIRWGSSSTDYWSLTSTKNFEGNAFINGWNLIGADWSSATTTGNPDKTKVNYLRISITYTGTLQTGVHLAIIASRLGKIFDILYYSKYMFRDQNNVWYETIPSADGNGNAIDESNIYINLDTEAQNIYLDQAALLCTQQLLGQDTSLDVQFFNQRYLDGVARYRAMYKSEVSQPSQMYYRQDRSTYRRFWGRNFNY